MNDLKELLKNIGLKMQEAYKQGNQHELPAFDCGFYAGRYTAFLYVREFLNDMIEKMDNEL